MFLIGLLSIIPNSEFPVLSPAVENDWSTDQNYAYRITMAIINGSLTDDLRLLEVGPVVHYRWLTLACRILRFYVSQNKPTKASILITKFCILVYLPSLVLQRNGYFAHQENVLVGMIGCNRNEIREMGVKTALSIPSNAANTTEEVRKFVIPKLNLKAHNFIK